MSDLPGPISDKWLEAVEREARIDYERDPDEATTGACEALAMAARIRELESEVERLSRRVASNSSWAKASQRELQRRAKARDVAVEQMKLEVEAVDALIEYIIQEEGVGGLPVGPPAEEPYRAALRGRDRAEVRHLLSDRKED